jgi:hypothetical protein
MIGLGGDVCRLDHGSILRTQCHFEEMKRAERGHAPT